MSSGSPSPRLLPRLLALGAAMLPAAFAAPLAGQDDVTLLGRRYGTVPPPAYYRMLEENPRAFQFSRGWMARNPRLSLEGTGPEPAIRAREDVTPPSARNVTGPTGVLGRRDGAVSGTFTFPVLLGLFAQEGPAAYSREQVQAHFFDGPNSRGGTVEDFFAEASFGAVQLQGEAQRWVASTLTRPQVTGTTGGLGGDAQVGAFIVSILDALDDGSIDWGRFDNDGPDGIPNSGDDDGFVDVVAVIHPTAGAECGGNLTRVWSHRWSLWAATGRPYATSTPAAGGGFVQVSDYTIQPLLDCAGADINDIGVLAHELGHGFGLPDLYCTAGSCGAGIGEWGLMGSGAWGCRGNDPARPCQMSAWSRSVLGWVSPDVLPPDGEPGSILLQPVQTTGRVLRYDIPGSREYYLLENRQPVGYDAGLHAPGLLVWHVDQDVVEAGWPGNRVNGDPARYGVRLVQADASGDLESTTGGRGDAGDPFPGWAGRTEFHAGSTPGALTHDGAVSGLTLTGLTEAGPDLSFHLVTRFQDVAVSTTGDGGISSLLEVDGVAVPIGGMVVRAAPEQRLSLRAEGGEVLSAGVRRPFAGWSDGTVEPSRTFRVGLRDTALVASYAGEEVQVAVNLEGARFGVAPGTVASDPPSPGLWFPRGTAVTLEAVATPGFAFTGWTGALAGGPNPVGLVVTDPVSAGAAFEFVFQVQPTDSVRAAAGDQLTLTLAATNASAPVSWSLESGELPPGTQLLSVGLLVGAPMSTGRWEVTVRARDRLGLEGTGTLVLSVGEPMLPLSTLAGSLLLGGESATASQAQYLDLAGNGNGFLDTGDLRSYLRRIQGSPPAATSSGELRRTLELVVLGSGRDR